MKCPHCAVTIHENWYVDFIRDVESILTKWRIRAMSCPACHKLILQAGEGFRGANEFIDPATWIQFYPQGSHRGPVPHDVPKDNADDYNEASLVLPLSVKASAALARRCLQSILREAGYPQYDLSKQIDAVLAETDTKKALPTGTYTIVDAIRQFGNFAAHRITDKTTLEVIDVEPHEADYCLDILDALFDHYYVRPATAARMKLLLNAKLQAAQKPPVK